MECKLFAVLLVFTLVEVNRRCFVDTAPLNDKSQDEVVTELEDLKRLLGNKSNKPKAEEISFSKIRSSLIVNHNGQQSGYDKIKSEVDKNGKLVAKIKQKMEIFKNKDSPPKSVTKTEVEIPSKGIHDFTVNEDQSAKTTQQNVAEEKFKEGEKSVNPGTTEFNPSDMAEYIYWTGDEKNVALMIEEFLEKGLMSRQEAINYLQSIKFNLDLMQGRDKNLQKIDKKNSVLEKQSSYENPATILSYEKSMRDYNKHKSSAGFKASAMPSFQGNSESEDMNDGTERLKLYKELSLEEVIYQLAKVMFSQSLNRGSVEAQAVLQKLVAYLQNEVKNGQVSINLQRKLLDVLFAALTDTLLEQTESMVAKKEDLLNLLDAYSPTPETAELLLPDIDASLGNLNFKQKLVEKKSDTKSSESSKQE